MVSMFLIRQTVGYQTSSLEESPTQAGCHQPQVLNCLRPDPPLKQCVLFLSNRKKKKKVHVEKDMYLQTSFLVPAVCEENLYFLNIQAMFVTHKGKNNNINIFLGLLLHSIYPGLSDSQILKILSADSLGKYLVLFSLELCGNCNLEELLAQGQFSPCCIRK